jgi:hypothetical protein
VGNAPLSFHTGTRLPPDPYRLPLAWVAQLNPRPLPGTLENDSRQRGLLWSRVRHTPPYHIMPGQARGDAQGERRACRKRVGEW